MSLIVIGALMSSISGAHRLHDEGNVDRASFLEGQGSCECLALFELALQIEEHQVIGAGRQRNLAIGRIATPSASGRMLITPSFIVISWIPARPATSTVADTRRSGALP